jgi:transposase
MRDQTLTMPEDPEELRSFTARLLAEVKAQAILIENLRQQLAGRRANRFGASSETAEQFQLALETCEIAAAAMTAQIKLSDIAEQDKPKRRPIPDNIPWMTMELTRSPHPPRASQPPQKPAEGESCSSNQAKGRLLQQLARESGHE